MFKVSIAIKMDVLAGTIGNELGCAKGNEVILVAGKVIGRAVQWIPGDEAVGGDVVGDLGQQDTGRQQDKGKQVPHEIGLFQS